MERSMWEIFIPNATNMNHLYSEWIEFVNRVSSGIIIMSDKPNHIVRQETDVNFNTMKSRKIICNEEEIRKIIDFTVKHYELDEVIAIKLFSYVLVKYKDGI